MKRNVKVSTAVIRRLPRYYRHLSELQRKGIVRISSSALGKSIGLTASQIRQDLFCFGGFGQQGYGYKVDVLKEQIGEILGISRGHTIVVLGAGNLGRALIENFKFSNNGFQLLAAFDVEHSAAFVTDRIFARGVVRVAGVEIFLHVFVGYADAGPAVVHAVDLLFGRHVGGGDGCQRQVRRAAVGLRLMPRRR